jgi:hypothetical protein
MDIPAGIIAIVGLLTIPCWLLAESRKKTRPLVRIGLGLCCISLIGFAASQSQSAPLYLHRQLLTAIQRELEEGSPVHVRRALDAYNRAYEARHDFVSPAIAASAVLDSARATRQGRERQPKSTTARIVDPTEEPNGAARQSASAN